MTKANKMKILSKIWEWLSLFLLGVVAGIVIFIKFLDNPDTVNQIEIKKIKNKDSDGNTNVIELQIDDRDTENHVKTKKKFRIKNLFKKQDR